ncbi:MAG TPA: hypothetical protein VHT49_11570 [Acidimicrobiales bacterium]|jgi:hypothetical protein|nr:hypothetical protein [Acidimicrobiales bacterium]
MTRLPGQDDEGPPEPDAEPDIVYGIGHEDGEVKDRLPHPLTPGRGRVFKSLLGSNLAFNGGAPSEPATSTPLAIGESDDSVPTAPLWAMKYLRHGQHNALTGQNAPEPLRLAIGSEDETIYAIDDGASHAMVARRVGSAPDGCLYCLVARVRVEVVLDVREGLAPLADVFVEGKELTLCGVVEGSVSNVVRVASYRKYRDVPADYLPPTPFIEFPDTL